MSAIFRARLFFVRKKLSPEDALELTQDVFFSVYKNIAAVRQPDDFEAWLFRIALNAFRNYLEKKKAGKRAAVLIELESEDEERNLLETIAADVLNPHQKQTSEERLKTLAQSEQNSQIAGREKERLEAEKAELQKQIDRLQIEIARAKEQRQIFGDIAPPPQNSPSALREKPDNSLVAVNTPIFDVFPADAVSRGGEQSQNKFTVPANAKNVVLILNAAGRADFPVYRVELFNDSGKTIWRGGGLRKDANGNFTLTVSGATLKAGNYRLKLFGKNGGAAAQTIAEYAVTIKTK